MNLDKLSQSAIEHALAKGASYADFRYEELTEQDLAVRDARPETFNRSYSRGFAIRLIADGAWGFAAEAVTSEETIIVAVEKAFQIARASATINQKSIELAPVEKVTDSYKTPIKKDPFLVSLSEKVAYLEQLESMMRIDDQITTSSASMSFYKTSKYFASSAGSQITQDIYQAGIGASCGIIKSHREQYERAYPTPGGQWVTGGYEITEKFDFAESLPNLVEEVKALAWAKDCPEGEMDVVLSGDMLSLQIHESVGHPLELDRVFGYERNFSGISFATPDKLDNLKYASELVTFSADSKAPGGLATYAYDDEGVKTEKTPLIERGMLVNYLSDRETASRIGKQSTACCRAAGWMNVPIVRIPNVLMNPGDKSFDQLIGEIDKGLYVTAPDSWSIDDNREGFSLGGQVGWLIEGGKLTTMVKSPRYSGSTVQFWNSCDAIGDESQWRIWGTPNCGKGQPGQNARTAQGCSPARFRKVRVG